MSNFVIISSFLISIFFIQCQRIDLSQISLNVPEKLSDNIPIDTEIEQYFDTGLLKKAKGKIIQGDFKEIHSLLIYKSGYLVFEEYFPGHEYQWDAPNFHSETISWGVHQTHVLQSVTKSFTSALIGVGIQKGFIKDVHDPISIYLPEYADHFQGDKSKITIEHLLSMTSGLDWKEWNAPYSSTENDAIAVYFAEEGQEEYVLHLPLVHEPGIHFTYSGGDMILLAAILRNSSGMDLNTYSKNYLFEPLGIDNYEWWQKFPNGNENAYSGLRMTPRNMLKFGMLYLNNGISNDHRILPENWVQKSQTTFGNNSNINVPGEDLGTTGYGYTWWIKEVTISNKQTYMYFANGWGGQKIVIVPEFDMIIVMNGGTFTSKVKEYSLLKNYIFPAVK